MLGELQPADVTAAIDAFFALGDPGLVPLGEKYELDVASAVAAHPFASKTLYRRTAGVSARRAAVRSAILLARPEKR
ncbi:hypothetical protein [Methylobacterium soli]|uniref:Uncharacterized protein n=1 Tax=Methylobacterium soli TaxID=553447 RepID=A0A6L3SUG6_9HYPH|nr:hypothetical protein [Methylobacterium soli]KAB1075401.1 hypothetical protein F6X53_24850 [Methylobacterium soli]